MERPVSQVMDRMLTMFLGSLIMIHRHLVSTDAHCAFEFSTMYIQAQWVKPINFIPNWTSVTRLWPLMAHCAAFCRWKADRGQEETSSGEHREDRLTGVAEDPDGPGPRRWGKNQPKWDILVITYTYIYIYIYILIDMYIFSYTCTIICIYIYIYVLVHFRVHILHGKNIYMHK